MFATTASAVFKQRRRLALYLLSLCLYATPALSVPVEKRIALVIGNANYPFSPLLNPVNDARAVATVLKQAGFEVQKYENISQTAMKRAILKFGAALTQGDIGLFYYAGHGVQVLGRNYLVPIDANIQYESDIEVEAVDLAAVLSKMQGAKNRLNIVILDACRNNPFTSNSRTLNKGLAFTAAPSGTLIAYSTAPGGIADDGNGKNGIYTHYLTQHILEPDTQIEDVFKRVRIDVKRKTGGRQIPWESSSLEGDFYFLPKNRFSVDIVPPSPAQVPAVAVQNPPERIAETKPVITRQAADLNCSDMREREAFSGSMGFDALSPEEQHYLDTHCP